MTSPYLMPHCQQTKLLGIKGLKTKPSSSPTLPTKAHCRALMLNTVMPLCFQLCCCSFSLFQATAPLPPQQASIYLWHLPSHSSSKGTCPRHHCIPSHKQYSLLHTASYSMCVISTVVRFMAMGIVLIFSMLLTNTQVAV